MMIGGVAYLYPFTLQDKRKKLLEWTGLALVIGSYFLISAENAWPGYLALFPVVGPPMKKEHTAPPTGATTTKP